MKTVSLSVINDLVTDNRVHKVCQTLQQMGFSPVLIGRQLRHSQPVSRTYQTHRMKLLFRKGPLFYLEYNLRLFFLLRKLAPDIFVANDLDSLPANFLVSRLKHKPLVYDSHEYFTEVPELIGRPRVQNIWLWLEKKMVPKVNAAYTVCGSIADIYRQQYGVDFKVVRNLPEKSLATPPEFKLPNLNNRKVILYQGALNMGRGLEAAIRAMQFIDGAVLVLAGNGDIAEPLKQLAEKQGVANQVIFTGRLALEQLAGLTRLADLGLSIEEDLGLNYRFALPNKLFDYIQAGVPVLVSDLPEMRNVVEEYQVGAIAKNHYPEQLAESIRMALFDMGKRAVWKQNLPKAAAELCWEHESGVIREIYSRFA